LNSGFLADIKGKTVITPLWKCYQGERFDALDLVEKEINLQHHVYSMTCTPEGDLWALLSNNQLLYYHTNSLDTFEKTFYPFDDANNLRIDGCLWWRDQLWIYGRGLFSFQAGELQEPKALPSDQVHSIFIDVQHRLVLCFAEAGIWCSQDGLEWESISLPSEEKRLFACASDAEGNLWAVLQNNRPYIEGKRVRYFTAFHHSRGWTNAQMSIWCYKRSQAAWQYVELLPKAARVMDMLLDEQGNCWIATEDRGVWQYSQATWSYFRSRYKFDGGIPSNFVEELYCTSPEMIWSYQFGDHLGVYQDGNWHSVMIRLAEHNERYIYWRRPLLTTSCYDPYRQRIWFGTAQTEIGWLDLQQPIALTPERIREYHLQGTVPASS
jgi:ligand-binding sensor domain-containing protein